MTSKHTALLPTWILFVCGSYCGNYFRTYGQSFAISATFAARLNSMPEVSPKLPKSRRKDNSQAKVKVLKTRHIRAYYTHTSDEHVRLGKNIAQNVIKLTIIMRTNWNCFDNECLVRREVCTGAKRCRSRDYARSGERS